MLEFWAGMICLFVILECITYQLVCIWFVPGALVNLLLLGFGFTPSLLVQTAIFAICAFISLAFLRKPIWDKLKPKPEATNTDSLIGKEVTVEHVLEDNRYRVKINSMDWLATCENDLEVGEKAVVTGIQGAKLNLEKKKEA